MTEEIYKLLEDQIKSEIAACKELEFLTTYFHKIYSNGQQIEIIICPTDAVGYLSSYLAMTVEYYQLTNRVDYRLLETGADGILLPTLKSAIDHYFNYLLDNLNRLSPNETRGEKVLWMAYYRLPLTVSQDEEEMRLWKELELLPLEYREIHRKLLAILNRRNDEIGKHKMEFLMSLISSKISKLYMDIGQTISKTNIFKVKLENFRKEPIIGAVTV